ncbi:uncharacterized protein LOC141629358 [Silene latifolia]|uniref:uncharacterized protein LOC141629358 n=1 Tax=Silene latifolia TaxID=37657 RepID=UPI003D770A73
MTDVTFVTQNMIATHIFFSDLAQNRYFENEALIGYLKYLQYWQRPEYTKFIMYPHCRYFLELLQNPNFRNSMAHPGSKVIGVEPGPLDEEGRASQKVCREMSLRDQNVLPHSVHGQVILGADGSGFLNRVFDCGMGLIQRNLEHLRLWWTVEEGGMEKVSGEGKDEGGMLLLSSMFFQNGGRQRMEVGRWSEFCRRGGIGWRTAVMCPHPTDSYWRLFWEHQQS